MYTEFFKLCGYEPEEIKAQRLRIEKAFGKLGIDEADIERGESRIRQFYDIDLKGLRLILGCYIKELIDLALAREENRKVIYGEWPGPANIILMAAARHAKDVYFGTPGSQILSMTFGSIFDKLTPLLETGEENGLSPGGGHCALGHITNGAIISGIIPKPDLLCSPGWFCDQAAEAHGVLEHLHDVPIVYHDGNFDWQWDEWPELGTRQIKYAGASLRKTKQRIEEVAGIELTMEQLNDGFRDLTSSYFNFQTLVDMMGNADPQPISQSNLDVPYFTFYTVFQNRDQLNRGLTTLIREVKQRIKEGKGVVPKEAPRIYACLRSPTDPGLMQMIESTGLNVCVCLADMLRPGATDTIISTDPCELMMEGVYRIGGPLQQCSESLAYQEAVLKRFKVDGVIWGDPYACRMSNYIYIARDVIQKEFDIPVMCLEYGGYENRQYTAGQLRTRVETFAELLKIRKAA